MDVRKSENCTICGHGMEIASSTYDNGTILACPKPGRSVHRSQSGVQKLDRPRRPPRGPQPRPRGALPVALSPAPEAPSPWPQAQHPGTKKPDPSSLGSGISPCSGNVHSLRCQRKNRLGGSVPSLQPWRRERRSGKKGTADDNESGKPNDSEVANPAHLVFLSVSFSFVLSSRRNSFYHGDYRIVNYSLSPLAVSSCSEASSIRRQSPFASCLHADSPLNHSRIRRRRRATWGLDGQNSHHPSEKPHTGHPFISEPFLAPMTQKRAGRIDASLFLAD